MMMLLQQIPMAILAVFGWLFAAPASAAQGKGDKSGKVGGFNFLPALFVVCIFAVLTACGGGGGDGGNSAAAPNHNMVMPAPISSPERFHMTVTVQYSSPYVDGLGYPRHPYACREREVCSEVFRSTGQNTAYAGVVIEDHTGDRISLYGEANSRLTWVLPGGLYRRNYDEENRGSLNTNAVLDISLKDPGVIVTLRADIYYPSVVIMRDDCSGDRTCLIAVTVVPRDYVSFDRDFNGTVTVIIPRSYRLNAPIDRVPVHLGFTNTIWYPERRVAPATALSVAWRHGIYRIVCAPNNEEFCFGGRYNGEDRQAAVMIGNYRLDMLRLPTNLGGYANTYRVGWTPHKSDTGSLFVGFDTYNNAILVGRHKNHLLGFASQGDEYAVKYELRLKS